MVVRIIGALALAAVMAVGITNSNKIMDKDQRQKLWKEVEQANKKSLPKSAVKLLDQIYDSAMQDKSYPEAVRALATKYTTLGNINQPAQPYIIRKLSDDVEDFPKEIRPIMKVILANWFFSYYQQNRWRFAQRSQTNQPPSDDFETWDLSKLLGEIDRLFTEALASSDVLKKIPITDYEELLLKGTVKDNYRPTLFDFLAFQALDFYSLDEQIIRKQGAFDLRADSPIFASIDQFLNWNVSADDEESFLLNAVKLYQEVLEFHRNDEDKTARIDANLHRLNFGRLTSVGNEKDARFQSALERFEEQHDDHPISCRALYSLAELARSKNELVRSHELASRGIARFADSVGGRLCFNLKGQIESKQLTVTTEKVWNDNRSQINFSYKNLDRAYFRLVKFDYENWRWGQFRNPANINKSKETFLKLRPVKKWSMDLAATDDYMLKNESITDEIDLPSGCYVLIASAKEDFSESKNIISLAEVWVSNLAVVVRHQYGDTDVEGQVFDSRTGTPVNGADVRVNAWIQDGRNSRSVGVANLKTDANGLFRASGRTQSIHRILISHQDQHLGLVDGNHKYNNARRDRTFDQTIFFTDRALYRPGQTVSFKGIVLRSDQKNNVYQTLANQKVTIVVRDVNHQEIERSSFVTNEFGSFAGSITAPRDRATGRMSIAIINGPSGTTGFSVEEYKRPKFTVEVEKPEEQFKLNDEVMVRGKAKAYTGAAIDGAKVTWRVVREVRYPAWWWWRCWWLPPRQDSPQEIANGQTKTAVDGSFEVAFDALPDLTVSPDSEPTFVFSLYADVTDTTGETRSTNQSVKLGYTSLKASLAITDWQIAQKPVELKLETTTLDGEKMAASGKLKIYRLKEPEKVHRSSLQQRAYSNAKPLEPNLSKIESWPMGELVSEFEFATDQSGIAKKSVELTGGAYKAFFETRDKSGKKVTAEHFVEVVDLQAGKFAIKVPHFFKAKRFSVEVGDEFVAVWGTGYDSGRAYVELIHRGKVFQSFWTGENNTQAVIKMKVPERLRGGFQIRLTYVRENRAYTVSNRIDVPWSNKQLQVKWEHFVSKLQPGGKETWTAIVSGPEAETRVAEMVAAMYDASLDAYLPHNWPSRFNVFYTDHLSTNYSFLNSNQALRNIVYNLRPSSKSAVLRYRYFHHDVSPSITWGWNGNQPMFGGGFGGGGGGRMLRSRGSRLGGQQWFGTESKTMELAQNSMDSLAALPARAGEFFDDSRSQRGESAPMEPNVDLSQVKARKNLNETAFFFPKLRVDDEGRVRIEFEVPEALTQWKFMGFAHDSELRTALLTDEAVTSKDLMVQPNPPRFLREGDVLEFSVKVSNQSATRQNGKVRLSFANAQNETPMDQLLGNSDNEKAFDIAAGQSKSLYWRLSVPDFVGVMTYKVVGATQRLSDGEEGFLPVLSKRILVTESLPLPIRGNQTREFDFERLKLADESDSLVSESYTVQMASNPSWYAIMALPYLMDYPHQCSEQVFNRLYANSIGQHIVNSDPKIKQIFDQWRGTDALDSPLEKNEDIRNVLIAESPWLRAGKDESQSRRNVAVLFDNNRLESETRSAFNRLKEMQYSDGSWSWFPGGRANDYITLYVTTGFGRLRHLGVKTDVSLALKSLDRLDNWIHETYQRILRDKTQHLNHLSPRICLYLYGRSFFLKDKAVDPKYKAAVDYFLGQAEKHWPKLNNRQSQGHLAIGLKRFGDLATPNDIMKSLTERSQTNDEMGMFWLEDQRSWWWYRAPIETQALLIEAYDEVLGDREKAAECKIWLLKQKQTQNWKTTKATADAVYALLMRGTEMLSSSKIVEIKLGGVPVSPEKVEAGTGFYEKRFGRGEIRPEMGQIEVVKRDEGIAWGSVHWQYLEDVGKIEPYEGTPLTLKKGLFIKKNTARGPVIEPVDGPVEVGDELVTRVEVRVDRDMEYVHLKDYRGSGTEPVNVLSKYKFQDGLSYYESTKDTASHFFIDYLPRGTYVFEYSVRVQHRGKYQTGIAELQCMYAPEFNSHSGSIAIEVK